MSQNGKRSSGETAEVSADIPTDLSGRMEAIDQCCPQADRFGRAEDQVVDTYGKILRDWEVSDNV